MAPEQIILVNALSPATDIYSLGLVAFEMLTGHALLGDSTHTEVLKRQLSAEVFYVPQDIPAPPDLRQVINTMIVKSPRDRYQSTAEVIAALDKLDISGIQAASHASSSDVFPAAPSTMETKYDRPTTGETPYENVQQPADQSGGNVPAYPQQQQHPNPYGQPPPQGYAPYPPQGYPPGYPPQGYPPQGYPPQGYYPQNPSGSGYPPQPHQYQNPSGNFYPPNPSGVSNSSVIDNISGTLSQILDPKSSGKTSYIMFGIGIVVLLIVLVTAGPGGFFRKFVGLSTCKDDSYEPNQRSLDGTVLTRGANISAHVCPGNDDWYFVGNRNPGDTVSITADFGEGSDPIAMELFIDSKFIERARTSAHGGIVSYRLKGRGAVAVRMKLAASEDGSAGRPYVITLESDQRSKPAL
jgi:hypothetical protein